VTDIFPVLKGKTFWAWRVDFYYELSLRGRTDIGTILRPVINSIGAFAFGIFARHPGAGFPSVLYLQVNFMNTHSVMRRFGPLLIFPSFTFAGFFIFSLAYLLCRPADRRLCFLWFHLPLLAQGLSAIARRPNIRFCAAVLTHPPPPRRAPRLFFSYCGKRGFLFAVS